MKIHAHILAWNEEKILPYTLDHYSEFCEKIFIYDNMSTDSSDEIYKKYEKVEVIKWDSGETFNDYQNSLIKSFNYRKKSRTGDVDWVICCDCDEFLYHPDLLSKLKEYKDRGITMPLVNGYDMCSEEFPQYDGKKLTDKVKTGSDIYEPFSKKIIFNPKLDVEYGMGAHGCKAPNAVFSETPELKLLHYKYLGKKYVDDLYEKRRSRLSQFNLNNNCGTHYFMMKETYEKMDNIIKTGFQPI